MPKKDKLSSAWIDYKDKSVLSLVFGHIGAIIEVLDTNKFGILLHPYQPTVFVGTLEDAKTAAEKQLSTWLTEAQAILNS